MDLDELAAERLRAKELCREHVPSVSAFKFQTGASFNVLRGAPEKTSDETQHLTTTATCIESLQDCHPTFWRKGDLREFDKSDESREQALKGLKHAFYLGACKRGKWVSEDSAPIYCACRALPLFLQCTTEWSQKHAALVAPVYEQLKEVNRFGIGEKTAKSNPPDPEWYPENAYHTYWALVVLSELKRFEGEAKEAIGQNLDRLRESLSLWARAKLAEEVALHWADSAMLDSDQLTWALTTFVEFERDLSSNLGAQDLIRKSFEALGNTQQPVGTWRHYRPLFVYSNVGNAYCYVYESFTYLLKALLRRFEQEEFLEGVVREFIDRLRRLRKYAEMTQVRDKERPDVTAWSSGHRPANPGPEGWATASVFSFFQAYRRLVGVLARRDALHALPRHPLLKAPNPIVELAKRGDTWSPPGENSVAEALITLFVNPVRRAPKPEPSEPDNQLIEERQARSAILFGPPGASKTTLAQHVAAALGWEYVELHSSHFVKEGIQAVQSTADRIFAQLKELDRAVVLFDEPDELVREREGAPDAFGRFLTTSMLPKVAELWKQGRIIYFVATNHIRYFDAAIIRSERFDVLVFVPPPSFTKKMEELRRLLIDLYGKQPHITVTQSEIEATLTKLEEERWGSPSPETELPGEAQVAKFILLRWDQIDELAYQLASTAPSKGILDVDANHLSTALQRIKDRRLSRLQTYLDYLDDLEYARRDFQRKPVYSVRNFPSGVPLPKGLERTDSGVWLACPSGECPKKVPGHKVTPTEIPGEVEVVPG